MISGVSLNIRPPCTESRCAELLDRRNSLQSFCVCAWSFLGVCAGIFEEVLLEKKTRAWMASAKSEGAGWMPSTEQPTPSPKVTKRKSRSSDSRRRESCEAAFARSVGRAEARTAGNATERFRSRRPAPPSGASLSFLTGRCRGCCIGLLLRPLRRDPRGSVGRSGDISPYLCSEARRRNSGPYGTSQPSR